MQKPYSYHEWEPKFRKHLNHAGNWVTAELTCLRCEYEWIGVYPDCCTSLDCPHCGYANPRYLIEPRKD